MAIFPPFGFIPTGSPKQTTRKTSNADGSLELFAFSVESGETPPKVNFKITNTVGTVFAADTSGEYLFIETSDSYTNGVIRIPAGILPVGVFTFHLEFIYPDGEKEYEDVSVEVQNTPFHIVSELDTDLPLPQLIKGPQGEPGEPGEPGVDGVDGDSAYQVAVAYGFEGTETEWLASLVGADGADGMDGADGVDGDSAYQVAVAYGFEGTEVEWLASLVGADGADGMDGADGAPGAQGEIGYPGFKYDSRRVLSNQYLVGEIVEYLGSYFICLANNDAIPPTGGAIGLYWNPYSFVGPQGEQGEQGDPGETGPAGNTGPAGPGIATGGNTGDLLVKNSSSNYDTAWTDAPTVDVLGFDTTAAETLTTVGTVAWNDGEGSLDLLMKGGDVTQTIGTQEFARVYNDSGVQLTKGQVVYISGAQGNRVAVKLAQANGELSSRGTLGFVAETISVGGEGFIIVSGALYKINTLGLTQGQPLFLSAANAGAYTTTAPVAPNHLVILGWVERVHATTGSIYVKVDNGYEIDELHNVRVDDVQNNDVLKYVSANNRWENSSTLSLSGLTLSNIANTGVVYGNAANQLTNDQNKFFFDSTSSDLGVANSSTSLVNNGSFTGSATGWVMPTGWSYSNNSVSHSADGIGALLQNIGGSVKSDRWTLKFTVSNLTVGSFVVQYQGYSWPVSQNGNYVYRGVSIASVGGNFTELRFTPTTTARFTLDDVSLTLNTGGNVSAGDVRIAGSASNTDGVLTITSRTKSNAAPGITRHISLQNNGSNTWIDFDSAGTLSHIGADSVGYVDTWSFNGERLYRKGTNAMVSENSPIAFIHYGGIRTNGKVVAGSLISPTTTLTSAGGTSLQVKYVTASQTLDDTATKWIADPSTPACTGSPSFACSDYTNQVDCLANEAHGGCTWFSGYSCSEFTGNEISCTANAECTWVTASCSAFVDQASCQANTGCSWTNSPLSCAGFNESQCIAMPGCAVNMANPCSPIYSPCTPTYADCGTLDEIACGATTGCSVNMAPCVWDGSTCTGGAGCDTQPDQGSCESTMYYASCSGSYFTGCSGTDCNIYNDEASCTAGVSSDFSSCSGPGSCSSFFDAASCMSYQEFASCSGTYDNFVCTGTYATGACDGSYGMSCQGDSTCGGISSEGACGTEAGCSWVTSITLNLPDLVTCPNRDYWIYNISSANADVIIQPYGSQQIDHASSYTLSNYKDWVHISPFTVQASCTDLNESQCASHPECVPITGICSWDAITTTCTGGGSCSTNTTEESCITAGYFVSCGGTYTVTANWFVFGK